jgi:hypothetical protein
MLTKFLVTIATLLLSVTAASGLSLPVVLAQEATPVAVAPPQDLLPATADYGTGETATINGVDIYYEIYGEGEPVLLLHSGLSNGDHWVNVIPALTDAGTRRSSWTAAATVAHRMRSDRSPTS